MILELGHFALVLALLIAGLQTVLPLAGASRGDPRLMAFARVAALAQLLCVALAFGALMQAFIISDFSVAAVANNSNSRQPLLYRMAGLWGNHEGSLLLWISILAIYGAATEKSEMMKACISAPKAMATQRSWAIAATRANAIMRGSPRAAPASGTTVCRPAINRASTRAK